MVCHDAIRGVIFKRVVGSSDTSAMIAWNQSNLQWTWGTKDQPSEDH